MIVIKTHEVEKTYDPDKIAVHALRGVSLEIEKGEFTAIVGPSGSGKTTLLNIIGGLDRPSTGTVHLGDSDISTLSDNQMINFRKDNIGFVFQAYNLIPVLTARENVEFIMVLVAVARALASKPKFILADEPTANLDSQSTADLLDMMARLNEEEQITFVFSTHDQRVIDRARRVVTLVDGKIASDEAR